MTFWPILFLALILFYVFEFSSHLGRLYVFFAICLVPSVFIFLSTKVRTNKNIQNQDFTIMSLLVVYFAFNFLTWGRHTSFEWTTTQDIPFLLRLLDPTFLANDFYTNSVAQSPRMGFVSIFYVMSKIGFDWYSAIYLFKVIIVIATPPFLYLYLVRATRYWHKYQLISTNYKVISLLALVCAGGFANWLQMNYTPAGWSAIQKTFAIAPMTLSFLIGLFYGITYFRGKRLRLWSWSFLFLSTLIHPVIGICHLILVHIIVVSRNFEFRFFYPFILHAILGVAIPIFVLKSLYHVQSPLDAATYILHYVNIRHPHHYLMSTAIGWHSVKWVAYFVVPFCLAILMKHFNLLILLLFCVFSIGLSILIQYYGTEVFKIKLIAELGPSRFTSFASIILSIGVIISISELLIWRYFNISCLMKRVENFLERSVFLNSFRKKTYIRTKECIERYIDTISKVVPRISFPDPLRTSVLFSSRTLFYILLSFCIFYAWNTTRKSPVSAKSELAQMMDWIQKNTPNDAVFHVSGLDSFFLRVYGRRAIYSDNAFPFHEDHILEFSRRKSLVAKYKKLGLEGYKCLQKYYPLHYLLLSKERIPQLKSYKTFYKKSRWVIYRIEDLPSSNGCK